MWQTHQFDHSPNGFPHGFSPWSSLPRHPLDSTALWSLSFPRPGSIWMRATVRSWANGTGPLKRRRWPCFDAWAAWVKRQNPLLSICKWMFIPLKLGIFVSNLTWWYLRYYMIMKYNYHINIPYTNSYQFPYHICNISVYLFIYLFIYLSIFRYL